MMRINFTRNIATLTASAILIGLPAVALADIAGTAHDFSTSGWNSTGEICVVCHTPHDADTSVASAPLWNHEVTTSTFTLYSSDTLTATLGQPDGVSKLCLSCHDGSVALDSFAGVSGSTPMATSDAGYVGTDLTDDHPISFVYDDTLATTDGGLFPPSTTPSGLVGTIDEDLLFGGKLQCGSCHDPHGVPGVAKFLVMDNAGSALCLTCHDK
jgi:predicted CXXCH cytochrome family protein